MFVGKLRRYKGVEDLIAAFSLAALDDVTTLMIAGAPDDAEYAKELQVLATELGLHHVQFELRYLTEDEMQMVLASADATVLPYHAIDQSGVLLYAMTCGAAVIAADLKPFREVTRLSPVDAAWFFPAGDVASLAQVLAAAVSDVDELRLVGAAGEALATTRFSWVDIARETATLYQVPG